MFLNLSALCKHYGWVVFRFLVFGVLYLKKEEILDLKTKEFLRLEDRGVVWPEDRGVFGLWNIGFFGLEDRGFFFTQNFGFFGPGDRGVFGPGDRWVLLNASWNLFPLIWAPFTSTNSPNCFFVENFLKLSLKGFNSALDFAHKKHV